MQDRPIKLPGAEHPITIEQYSGRVAVSVAGRVIADTRAALTLREAAYAAVQYLPRSDVDLSLLERSEHVTYCPYKGECRYFSIPIGGERAVNSVWSYEQPYAAVASIAGHLAFYRERVGAIDITAAS